MASGTSFWKVFFGVLLGLFVAGSCAVGGCLYLAGRTATSLNTSLDAAKKDEEAYAARMKVTDIAFGPSSSAFTRVTRKVTNTGNRTVMFCWVSVRYLDAGGAIVDTGSSVETTLAPGDTKNFQVLRPLDEKAETVNVTIERITLKR